MSSWLLLITNLPGRNQTLRMRLWRGLKATGAATLRDGVYLLPNGEGARREFEARAAEIELARGSAHLLVLDAESTAQQSLFQGLFDRSADYGDLLGRLAQYRRKLPKLDESVATRDLDRLQRELALIVGCDFFPGASRRQAEGAIADAKESLSAQFSIGEPHAIRRKLHKRKVADYQARVWTTREHLWIDRVCSAWLIKRFIDPKARFLWLKQVKSRPAKAVGFDFDGAEFSHVGAKVTFEVLLHSFGLENDPGLTVLGALVHYLDVGGVPVPEAAGLAAIVGGARATWRNDDDLLAALSPVLDSLYTSFSERKDK
jgi:hypothetical protein